MWCRSSRFQAEKRHIFVFFSTTLRRYKTKLCIFLTLGWVVGLKWKENHGCKSNFSSVFIDMWLVVQGNYILSFCPFSPIPSYVAKLLDFTLCGDLVTAIENMRGWLFIEWGSGFGPTAIPLWTPSCWTAQQTYLSELGRSLKIASIRT